MSYIQKAEQMYKDYLSSMNNLGINPLTYSEWFSFHKEYKLNRSIL